jgi:hypothetical protein
MALSPFKIFMNKLRKIKILKFLKNAAGISIVDVMIAMGLGFMVISSLGTVVYFSSRNQAKDNQKVSAVAARNFVHQALTNWRSYRATLVGNAAAFACALNNTGCTAAAKGNFVLYARNAAGALEVLYDPTNLANGLDENGVPCTATSGNAPSANCPVRVNFSWVPLCTSGCTDPVPISISTTILVYDVNKPSSPQNAGVDFTMLKSVHQRRCLLPWSGGSYVNDGATFTAWNAASPVCASVTRTCTDTELDNQYSYSYENCYCTTPWGSQLAVGNSVTAYLTAVAPCTSQVRTCNQATGLSGTYSNQNCYADCTLPWGGNISHGASVTAYLTSTPTCTSETRTCNNGTLSGSYTFQACSGSPCTLPWGGSIAHGASVTAWNGPMQKPTCTLSETRTCNNGSLSGSWQYQTCSNCSGVIYPTSGATRYCWHTTSAFQSCTTTCSTKGGCVAAGVLAYGTGAGNSGPCYSLIGAVTGSYPGTSFSVSGTFGCVGPSYSGGFYYWGYTAPTSCATSYSYRMCSCAN